MGAVAYLTDVEGIWEKVVDFATGNALIHLDEDRLVLADGVTFVFGGDAIDRGPWSRRVVSSLLDAKRRYGDRVILLAGNRDINKVRLARELSGHPPTRAPREVIEAGKPALLRWILETTMGAKRAFDMRLEELSQAGGGACGDDVVASFVADIAPDGQLTEYLTACQLAYRHDTTLFLHGAVTEDSLGIVPGHPQKIPDLTEWIETLNAFYKQQMDAFRERRMRAESEPIWAPLVAYQAPLPGTRLNQASVVYGRPADALGNPRLPPPSVIEALQRAGVGRVVVGHTPSGDSPSVLCSNGFQLVIADNSYGRLERGAQVEIEGARLRVVARARLDTGEDELVTFELADLEARPPIGLRDRTTGRLIKGRLASGEYLGFRFLEGFAQEQLAFSSDACATMELTTPTV